MQAETTQHVLTGWGRTAPSGARVRRPRSDDDVAHAVDDAPDRGTIARGLGRSYGDAAQNAGGEVLDMTGLHDLRALDLDAGVVKATAGTSLDELMRRLVPLGWFVPVTPGTRYVTVGGAIAADIHGKNHQSEGSFCTHVRELTLQTATGERLVVGPDRQPDVFWA
ncbi:MAG TPA: FAD-binding oxidoreductase, partial [Acidimicrobiia bacterium]|nr:FAD-binding oxidoreductase [Acidimicrobiia bacterium]